MSQGPESEIRSRVSVALAAELRMRGLTHEDVAGMLGKSVQTVRNKISVGNFTEKMAREWSEVLGIPYDTFFPQADAPELAKRFAALERD